MLLNPFGPVHNQDSPLLQVNSRSWPEQIGEFDAIIGSKVQLEQSIDAPSISI